MPAVDTYVPVGTDGAGDKKIRNLQIDILQPDGTVATVQMQVVAISDRDGRAFDLNADRTAALLVQILEELKAIRTIQGAAAGVFVATANDL